VDHWVLLAAPNFACVERWRGEQEAKLVARRGADHPGIMAPAAIARFIQFYQRLTEWSLREMPQRVDSLYRLGAAREVISGPRWELNAP
jgi:D-glycerate 3-kinase